MVVRGLLQIHLVDARDLKAMDTTSRMDPYVILRYMGQERKSRVLREGGSNPTWNETFTFQAEYPSPDNQHNLVLKIMDEDTFSADDFAGAATINVGDLLQLGAEKGSAELPPHRYRVVLADAVTKGISGSASPSSGRGEPWRDIGGWKVSGGVRDGGGGRGVAGRWWRLIV
ncbi:unnamed protein product [Spirodela intermedia]|uniref:C2 domain-containing protein n=1 Tax=Spirodela intermedia TaxID=51605 RepID=A0A7I8IBM3_SPIIN|nr:unnamed protein product [Spirodela intermedia]CAA6654988.1 unnamed protein product [Spirodela intermedia]